MNVGRTHGKDAYHTDKHVYLWEEEQAECAVLQMMSDATT